MFPIKINFSSEKLKKEFFSLKNGKAHEKELYKFLTRALEDLKEDYSCAIKIPRRLWPKYYKKYGITNLWKYDLPNAWRLVFTVKKDELTVIALVLEWFCHDDYQKRFGY